MYLARILIIDDEREVGNFLSHLLSKRGHEVKVAISGKEFQRLVHSPFHLAMIDLKLPDSNGIEILKELKFRQHTCKAIIMTGYSTIETAVQAIRMGANDYIEKPFDDINQLEGLIEKLLGQDMNQDINEVHTLAESVGFVVGKNENMLELLTTAHKIAKKHVNVLIEGETGSGKEVLARFIHHASQRGNQPFIGVNCGALSESLLESELFGHEKGSFTGATQQRKGLFEIASDGTLFLDEIAEASSQIQVKLLRVLETREFMRLGSEKSIRTNARLIAASHTNLAESVKLKKFREDLYYRLNVVKLQLPPLRERKEELPLLIHHLLKRISNNGISFSKDAMELMQTYEWPGNIRELGNVITRAVTLAEGETAVISPYYLPPNITSCLLDSDSRELNYFFQDEKFDEVFKHKLDSWVKELFSKWDSNKEIHLEDIMNEYNELGSYIGKIFVKKALRTTFGDRRQAANFLNINMRRLRYLLNEKGHSK